MKSILIALLCLIPINASALDVTLAWDASVSPSVTGYEIVYSYDEIPFSDSFITVDVGDALTVTILDIDINLRCNFVAVAYNTSGLRSNYSNMVFTIPPTGTAPGQPQGLDITR
jgi:hypothetical protein